ncbi:TonB-dependent siderophore receptor [Thalassospira marina]|uniref:TonB-dependent siderophore receptor n=1 Tax=Thalassospira marina TaxID=2048283 RepID=A0A2N3KRU5_9PROT|nr:TonB-dependent siderophore receptor [Thalassospira marina]PKR53299.1 TonB-dependent siderophore receptor [Thalassospira marina]
MMCKTAQNVHARQHGARFTGHKALVTLGLYAGVSLAALHAAQAQQATDATQSEQQGTDPITLDPIRVEGIGERGDGPVQGYVAKRSRAGTKTDTPLMKTSQSVSVVPAEQIEDQQAGSVAEALRYSAGVFTEYRGMSNQHDEMYVRGFSYVPRYLDGLDYGLGSLGQVEPYFLERVEVLRGPSSILYGQANPGGIVNLVSKKADGDLGNSMELTAGTDNLFSSAIDLSGILSAEKGISWRMVAKGITEEEQAGDVDKKRIAVMPSVNWTPNDRTDLTVSLMYQNDPDAGTRNFLMSRGLVTPTSSGYIPQDFYIGNPNFEESSRTQTSVGYELEHILNDTITLRQNARYTNIEADVKGMIGWSTIDDQTIDRRATAYGDELEQYAIDNQAQFDFATGAFEHTVLVGLDAKYSVHDGQYKRSNTSYPINWTSPDYGPIGTVVYDGYSYDETTKSRQIGLYAQEQLEIGQLTLSAGGRHDWADNTFEDNAAGTSTDYSDSAFSGRLGAIYNFSNGLAPYVSYSTSFEPQLGSNGSGAPYEPVTAQQYEAGIKFGPDSGRYQLIASVYKITQQNVVSRDPTTNLSYQTGEIESRGYELEAHAEILDNLNLVASYSHINAEITKDANPASVGLKRDRTPEDQASLWLKQDIVSGAFDGLGLGAGVRYIGESTDRTNTIDVPDVTLFDAMLSYDLASVSSRLEGAKLQLNATNLTDETYVASCAGSTSCFYGPGRTVTATLKYSW